MNVYTSCPHYPHSKGLNTAAAAVWGLFN